MKPEKFIKDAQTVLKFIQLYCDNKHEKSLKNSATKKLHYKGEDLHVSLEYTLCATCEQTFLYSHERLLACPHEEKPSCRKCPNPCYEKSRWKELAGIMKYSGMRLGLIKIRKLTLRKITTK